MDRRAALKSLAAGGIGLFGARAFAQAPLSGKPLLSFAGNNVSVETLLNSRWSVHGGYSPGLSKQVLSDVLWAGARAPVAPNPCRVFVATPEDLFLYDAQSHALVLHAAGDHRSETNSAFEIAFAGQNAEHAGMMQQLGMLTAVSYCSGLVKQPVACPKESVCDKARATWETGSAILAGTVFAQKNLVSTEGLTRQLRAISIDSSLPNPDVVGAMQFNQVLTELKMSTEYRKGEIPRVALSQLLWAAYGCSNHKVGDQIGLTVASAKANYYLLDMIYLVLPDGIYRYCVRSAAHTRGCSDHRIMQVCTGDKRAAMGAACTGIPNTASAYIVMCSEGSGIWERLEAGYAGINVALQATALKLQPSLATNFTDSERVGLCAALGLPPKQLPLLVASVGIATKSLNKNLENADYQPVG